MFKPSPLLAVTLALLLALAYGIFSQGLGGGLYFDDRTNLALLSQVNSFDAAMQFAFSGTAGSLGRPLSLGSFALQVAAWPHKPEAFIQVNILIHLFNGALVAWFALLLANITGTPRKVLFVALITALWLLSPIQVSPVLFIVQRMTLLAGLFTLLGLIFYLLGRRPRPDGKPTWLWIGLAFAMTIPATLSKENGVLLPGFLLILEFFLLGGNGDSVRSVVRSKLLAAWAAGMLLFGLFFLYRYWPSFTEIYAAKGYSPAQHLATEVRAVVHYLSQILIPDMPKFGPFHDDFPISAVWYEPRALAAMLGLSALAGLAWWSRRRSPLFSAGVFIFLWGHALESSVIPLEPYFEHRNYIPLLGVALALTGLAQSFKTHRKLASVGLAGLLLLYAFSAFQYAAIWGKRTVAVQYWYAERPDSTRAVLFWADLLAQQRKWSEINQLVRGAWQANPNNIGLAITLPYLACRSADIKLENQTLAALTDLAREGVFNLAVAQHMNTVTDLVSERKCPALRSTDILAILDALSANPHYQVYPETVSDLLVIRSKLLFAQGQIRQSAEVLKQAIGHDFRLGNALNAATMYLDLGLPAEAANLMQRSRAQLPSNPWLRAKWLKDIENTEARITRYRQKN